MRFRKINYLVITLSSVFLLSFNTTIANAVSGSEWRAGRIIDDSAFTNADTMTVSAIQDFLNRKVGTNGGNGTPGQCDTYGTKTSELGGGTRAQYGISRGNGGVFTCLKDYYEVPKLDPGPGIPASNYGGASIPSGAKSAAQIIWDAAQTYRISPRVILVTIQKESAGPLITDDWPLKSQYTYAMGARCPDTAPCDANYAGFSIQIRESARLFRYYLDNMRQSWWPYKKPGNNTILYNPNAACGSTNVNIETSATAALYTYTPYQPNQAALNNLYGSGDSCSAYGNRNFWRMFRDWFGSTKGLDYDGYVEDISISTNSSTVPAHEATTIIITARNTGNQAWSNSNYPVRLGTWSPQDHDSALYHPSWVNPHRPAALNQSVVEPGASGTFTFTIYPPNRSGIYQERFNLVSEGSTWFDGDGYLLTLNITKKDYTWSMVSQSSSNGFSLLPGQASTFTLVAKNTGNVTWTSSGDNPVRLGTWAGTNRNSAFYDPSWILPARPAVLQESSVAPGQNGTFVFNVRTPSTQKFYVERFNLVMDGISWMQDPWMEFNIDVRNP